MAKVESVTETQTVTIKIDNEDGEKYQVRFSFPADNPKRAIMSFYKATNGVFPEVPIDAVPAMVAHEAILSFAEIKVEFAS